MKAQTTQEITSRIREAAKIIFSEWGAMRRFCLKYDINYHNFNTTINESEGGQKRYFTLASISAIVLEFGVSADWILTGRGSMFSGEEIAKK